MGWVGKPRAVLCCWEMGSLRETQIPKVMCLGQGCSSSLLDRVSQIQKSQKLCERNQRGGDPRGAHVSLNNQKPCEFTQTHPVFNSKQCYKGQEAQGIQL